MATNSYFPNFTCEKESSLIQDLIVESIKMFGHDIKYLPRSIVAEDDLFGEDTLSTFDFATDIEVYIKNVEGFEGQGDFLSKFNLEIRDQITFVMARRRWDEIKTEKLVGENGYEYLLEDGSERCLIELEDGNGDNYTITSSRPLEGDLIYFPLVKKLFEIKFVEHEQMFYPLGQLQIYELRCELFEYSSERLDTGVSDIDAIEDNYSKDVLKENKILLDGFASSSLLLETGDTILQEYRVEDTTPTANNEFFSIASDDIIDFSETHPWSEIDRF